MDLRSELASYRGIILSWENQKNKIAEPGEGCRRHREALGSRFKVTTVAVVKAL